MLSFFITETEHYLQEASKEGSPVQAQVGEAYDSLLQLLAKYPDQYNKDARRYRVSLVIKEGFVLKLCVHLVGVRVSKLRPIKVTTHHSRRRSTQI